MSKHNLNNVNLTVGTTLIKGGYGETDAITFENVQPIAEMTYGADGHEAASFNVITSLLCTITLLPTSLAYTLLSASMALQRALADAPGPLPPLPFLMVDTSNGDTVQSLHCTFIVRPLLSKAKKIGEVTFQLNIRKPVQIRGPLNIPQ